jgi:hypothetical protein
MHSRQEMRKDQTARSSWRHTPAQVQRVEALAHVEVAAAVAPVSIRGSSRGSLTNLVVMTPRRVAPAYT